jgi:cation/acetate symporter
MNLLANAQTNAGLDRMIAGRGQFSTITVASILAIALFMFLLEKTGVPENYNVFLFGTFLCGTLAVIGVRSATVFRSDWFLSGKVVSAPINAMAVATVALGGPVLITLPGLYFSGSLLAMAVFAAPLAGLALASFFTGPHITNSGTASLGVFMAARFNSRILTTLVVLAVSICCILLLWSQLRIVAGLGGIFFGLAESQVLIAAAVLVAVTVVPGGIFGIIRANSFCFILAAMALLSAASWLSVVASWIPVPQIGMGLAAFEPVQALESQLDQIGIPRIGDFTATGWPRQVDLTQASVVFLFLAIATMALPALMNCFQPLARPETARQSAGWAAIFCAIVLTAAPAIAVFAKLGIYTNLLGIAAEEVAEAANWVFYWSGRFALFTPDQPLILICGSSVNSAAAAIAACGGDPDHAIGPADITVHGELASYGLAQIYGLPHALTVIGGAGLIACTMATANMLAFSAGSALSEDGRACFTSRPLPDTGRVFAGRIGVLVGIVIAVMLAAFVRVSPAEPVFWGLAVSAGMIAPCLVLSIWWRKMTATAAIAGIGVAAIILLVFWILAYFPQVSAVMPLLPGYILPSRGGLPVAIHAAAYAMPAGLVTILVVSLFRKKAAGATGTSLMRAPEAS